MSVKDKTILLLGTGYTLACLIASLDKDKIVITTTSAEKRDSFIKEGIAAEVVDVRDLESVKTVFLNFPEIEVVVDSVPPLNNESDETLGVRNICQAIRGSKVKRLIYLSTTGVFGRHDGSLVDEGTTPNPDNKRSLARYKSEELYFKESIEVCAFRIAAIYGPGRGIGNSIKSGSYKLIEGYDRWSNRIHVTDLAQAIKHAVTYGPDKMLPKVLCLSDDAPALTSEIVKFYCERFGLSFPEKVSLEEAKRKGMHSLVSNQKVSNALLKQTFGMQLKYPSYIEGAETEFE